MAELDELRQSELCIDGRTYKVQVFRRVIQPVQVTRLVVISYQPNERAQQVLRVCIQTIRRYTPEPHELWVIDNTSPMENTDWLLRWPNINVVLNRTEPLPPQARNMLGRLMGSLKGERNQLGWGSYANAIGLEIAVRLIDPGSHHLMTLHMDTMPCRTGWLSFLRSKLRNNIAAAGMRMDKARTPEGVLHILGCLVDFQLLEQLGLDFMPQLPQYDVGDRMTVTLREAGYDVWACPNTLWEPQLAERIPASSPLRHLRVDRSFDDEGNAIFLHLGRGLKKSSADHRTGITVEEWVEFANDYLLA